MIVHNQSDVPFTYPNGINISPGFETYVGISRDFTNKLGSPYSNCVNEFAPNSQYAKKLYNFFDKLNITTYKQDLCFTLCYQEKLINKCGCCDIRTPPLENETFCSTDSEIECLNEFYSFFSSSDLNVLCDLSCPPNCETLDYNLITTQAKFPSLNYLKLLQLNNSGASFFPNNASDDELKTFASTGFLKLIVNYDNLYYNFYDEKPAISTDDAFGIMGGNFACFLGISLLSFIELLELILVLFFIFIEHLKNKKTIHATY